MLNPFSDNFILKQILDWLNPFSENFILKKVIEFLGEILSYINPFHENFFGKKIIELFKDLLVFLFVPEEESITSITSMVESKFGFIDTIKDFISTLKNNFNNLESSPTLSVNIGATKYTQSQTVDIINLNWYKPFKPFGDMILTAFIYILFVWRLFISLPSVINATGGSINNIKGDNL